MKKSLKVIASAAMALSMFSSVALADTTATGTTTTATAVKTSKDFKDLAGKDAALLAKIDALLASKTFEGTANDSFGIDQNMNRAQVAKVLTLIYNVKVDDSVKTSSFTDVKADDSANGWAIPYIEAAKKAGLIDGMTDTTFAPADNVTLGQFATLLVKGLGKKVDVTGTPWYKDAVAQAVSLKILPEGTDGAALATRADLVNGAFNGQAAYKELNQPAQVSVASVKATGVKTVVVNFDRDVDTSKATLSLKKGTIAVATTAKFSDDKKSATLTLTDTNLRAGDYTVTLGGLDASAVKTATGTFTAQDETVQKIEFVSTSDNVAISQYASVYLKATNQYGENASFSAGNYTVNIGNSSITTSKIDKLDDGTLKVTIDTKNPTGLQSSITIIPVTVWYNDTRVSVTKNFTLGTQAFITKMNLGDVKYSVGSAINKSGETAKFDLNAFDQYGNKLSFKAIQEVVNSNSTDLGPVLTGGGGGDGKVQVVFSPYETNLVASVQDFDGNDTAKVRIALNTDIEKAGEYTAQVYLQGANATQKISVGSNKVATKVQIGDQGKIIAAGDKDTWIPIVAYDANGEQLTIDDLTSDVNVGRININVTGATADNEPGIVDGNTAVIYKTGDHKGSIKLGLVEGAARSVVTVTAYIATPNANSTATKTYNVNPTRVPDRLKLANAPSKKLVNGAYSKLTVQVIDQYGESMDYAYSVNSNGDVITFNPGSSSSHAASTANGSVRYAVYVQQASSNPSQLFVSEYDNRQNTALMGTYFDSTAPQAGQPVTASVYYAQNTTFDTLNNDYAVVSNGTGTLTFTARLMKLKDGQAIQNGVVLSTITSQHEVVSSTDKLTYSLDEVGAIFNAKDNGAVATYVYDTGAATLDKDAAQLKPEVSKLAREITVSAKNAAGETVGVPKKIVSITSSNPSVAVVAQATTVDGDKAFVLGNKAGTATVTVGYVANDGSIKTLSTNVTVKADSISTASLKMKESKYTLSSTGFNAFVATELTVYDNYGVKYEKLDAQKYNYLLGVAFSVTNVRNNGGNPIVVDKYGNITNGIAGATFDLTAVSASGKTATTSITLN